MKYGNYIKDITVSQQIASIKSKYNNFIVSSGRDYLKAVGQLKPTVRSDTYTVEIKYHFKSFPKVHILKPELVKNFNGDAIPHTYTGKELCLFMPKYNEFKFSNYISETIIPWTSLWLYYYEAWHITGEWLGGGEHPIIK